MDEAKHRQAARNHKLRILAFAGAAMLIAILIFAGLIIWRPQQSNSLLPQWAAEQISGFTPYFYPAGVPSGYSIDESRISSSDTLLMIPLTKTDGTAVVITQQELPKDLDEQTLLENGDQVEGAAGPAVISKVERRIVGTMVAAKHNTLVLLNATGNANEDDVAALLKELRPL